MRQEKNTMLKNVLTPNSIMSRGWSLAQKDNLVQCPECKSSLFYVRREWGVVEESSVLGKGIKIAGYRLGDRYLAMRELGFALYCCECGDFEDDFNKWMYNEKQIVCSWDDDELDIAEREEIEQAINVYNHTGQVKANYEGGQVRYLREKIKEYEQKNNIESVVNIKKKKKKLLRKKKNAGKRKNRKNKTKRH